MPFLPPFPAFPGGGFAAAGERTRMEWGAALL